jgi:drug/metabolite transporter (DMT)-like permease
MSDPHGTAAGAAGPAPAAARAVSATQPGLLPPGALSPGLLALVIFLTALWGVNAVLIKITTQGMTPIMAAGLRGAVALLCLTAYGLLRGESFAYRGWPLFHGAMNGLIFAVEFVLIYSGARLTTGSHTSIFINTAPFFVAVGAHYLLPNDQLRPLKVTGLVLAFLGVVTLFSNDILVQHAVNWRGDVLVLAGAGMWGVTTVYIKRAMVYTMSAFRLLYIQILISTPVLIGVSLLAERDWFVAVTPLTVGALLFQALVIVFFTYMMWMVLLKRFTASALQSFTFLTPVWGVFFGITLLGDPVQALMLVGIALVGVGLYLINRPRRFA